MRLIRLQGDGHLAKTGVERLVETSQADLVQIDYPRPRSTPAPTAAPVELPERASQFADVVRVLAKQLYLNPDLRVIASAGWRNAYACAEEVAAALAEAGCGDVSLAAVRGSHLLPILDDLARSGVKLRNAETQAAWRDLKAPLVGAELLLGAGPIATALTEGARVVVAGSYDGASPLTAAAATQFGWGWDDYARLAAAAVAARAALWHDPSPSHAPRLDEFDLACTVVELDADGAVRVSPAAGREPLDAAALRRWIIGAGPSDPALAHADVRCDYRAIKVEMDSLPHVLSATGVSGLKPDGMWRLEVVYSSGYGCEALIEIAPAAEPGLRERLSASLNSLGTDPEQTRHHATVQHLTSSLEGGASWIHAALESDDWRTAQQFAGLVAALVESRRDVLRLPAGRPVVETRTTIWPCRIPRGEVDVAVDTRPAKDWL
jgi:hypothetical protein